MFKKSMGVVVKRGKMINISSTRRDKERPKRILIKI